MAPRLRDLLNDLREVLRRPEPKRVRFGWKDLPFLLRFARPIWPLGVAGVILTVVTTGLGSLLPLSSKVLIDFIILKKGTEEAERTLHFLHLDTVIPFARLLFHSLGFLILAMIVIAIAIGLLGMVQRYLSWRFEQELAYNLQTTLFQHVLCFPMSFFKKAQVGYLMSRVSDDVDALQYLFMQSTSQLIHNGFYLLFVGGILFTLSVKLSLILIGVLPVYVLINLFFGERLRSVYDRERESVAEVARDMQEVLSGVEVVKSYVTEEKETGRVSGRLRGVIRARVKAMALSLMSGYSVRAAQFGATLLVMWFGAHEIWSGAITIGDYVAFTTYLVFLTETVRSLSLFHLELQPMFACLDRLMELFHVVPEVDPHGEQTPERTPEQPAGEIQFQDVTFSYLEGHPVLRGVSFRVKPGDVVALVGFSGAGKTTLINLILKFYTPQVGSIRLDGQDISHIHSRWLREQIGVVSQDVFLFNDTIEANIRYGRPRATRDQVVEAAQRARIHEDILGFPDGYDTVVGERGATLSAGQRQRISMARAFLKDPPILILDEPTSALDSETERLLKDSLRDLVKGRTTFIITHRKFMVDVANRIFVLAHGTLTDSVTRRTEPQQGAPPQEERPLTGL